MHRRIRRGGMRVECLDRYRHYLSGSVVAQTDLPILDAERADADRGGSGRGLTGSGVTSRGVTRGTRLRGRFLASHLPVRLPSRIRLKQDVRLDHDKPVDM